MSESLKNLPFIIENGQKKYLINVDKVDGKDANEIGITVQREGTEVGYQATLNFIQGDNIVLTITNDTTNNRINIKIDSTGSGNGGSQETCKMRIEVFAIDNVLLEIPQTEIYEKET